ncbi:DNA topoisomerase III [Weizmannia acidilactici]|uniref:DNA topoisomerase n=1 Tax=Weizmannia acidilactici TaxID=2607726 RepID=A0A5J4JPX9_9BACI|nr:DNA topoisomerase III [Weizmannia acidilactici]GER68255.1 DNA topoisomerase III [Weizmannia acidilactici]GER71094.1 DNA topoisomerase III [Weizmannia acidilactici]GER74524.1 DNA topoisomerase III [Weizmannia acidilactici]
MKSLVLAEKPSVGRELARVLGCKDNKKRYIEGPKYIVTWALGHLIELKMPEDYDPKYKEWRMEDLPIIPDKMQTKIIRQTFQQYKAIEQLGKRNDIKDCIIATDAGREGELVARWILEKMRWKKPVKRLWISSQTDKAIKSGFNRLKPAKEYDHLYHSAVCRSEADWLIGLNVSRALTVKYNDPLSAGRVQTPTLAMVLEREKEIQSFVPKKYWTIEAQAGKLEVTYDHQGEKRIFDEQKAKDLYQSLGGQTAVVTEVVRKEKTEQQPLPYDLTELQRDANHRFGFTAKKTLNVLQDLYERHKLVTYPRTDSKYLTKDMENTMYERLVALKDAYKQEIQPVLAKKGKILAKRVINDAKVTDHHAIIPTDERPVLSDLSSDERKIYDMIVKRFLALFYPVYEYETVKFKLDAGGKMFTGKTTVRKNAGYTAVFHHEAARENTAPLSIKEGKTFKLEQLRLSSHLTEAPKRYSEADILSKMEKFGLGTPATRADIIERLVSSETISRENGRLVPTPKGKQLIDLVNDELKSPELTAKWEKQLEAIARGKGNPKQFLDTIRKETVRLVREIQTSDKKYRAHNLTGTKCPECGSLMKEVNGQNGKMLVCSNRECRFTKRKGPKLSNRRCPTCHKRMEIHHGKSGVYFQCRTCNIAQKADEKKTTLSKHEERKLLQKYAKKDDTFGNSLAEAFKAAMKSE